MDAQREIANRLLQRTSEIELLMLELLKRDRGHDEEESRTASESNEMLISQVIASCAGVSPDPVVEAALLEVKRVTESYRELTKAISARDTEKMESMAQELEMKHQTPVR